MDLLAIIIFYELGLSFLRKSKRRRVFKQALERKRKTGKKLLVIGDPSGGFFNSITGVDYGYGDECVDLQGCPKADASKVIVHKDKVENVLPKLNLEEYVIFQSCVFEYVDEFSIVQKEIENVLTEDLYFVNVEPYSISAYLYGGFLVGDKSVPKRVLYKYPPDSNFVSYYANPLRHVQKIVMGFTTISLIYFTFCY